jgi:hypothetical protein
MDAPNQPAATVDAVVEVHLREVAQLFDSMDPCPFYERDLEPDAEDYITASVFELGPRKPTAIVVYVDEPAGKQDEEAPLEQAIHRHFTRKTRLAARELREVVRRGWISLLIGLAFLSAMLVASEAVARGMSSGPLADILRESLVIGGWVAMWKPLEVFLYDWWPIVGRRGMLAMLSRLPVRLVVRSR